MMALIWNHGASASYTNPSATLAGPISAALMATNGNSNAVPFGEFVVAELTAGKFTIDLSSAAGTDDFGIVFVMYKEGKRPLDPRCSGPGRPPGLL